MPNLRGGGAERLHLNLANYWIKMGFNVEFILMRKEGELVTLVAPEVTFVDLNVGRIRSAVIPLLLHMFKSKSQVILVAMWPLTLIAIFSWFLTGRRGKLFVSDHENLSLSYEKLHQGNLTLIKKSIEFSYPLASGIIAVSRGVKQDLCLLGNLPENLVCVINNPAATGMFFKRETKEVQDQLWGSDFEYHILSVGRLAPEKNHASLINAFALLPKALKPKLIILGEGPSRSSLEALVKQLDLEESVSLPGFMIDPYPWFRSADLFVLSSLWEGFGNVIVEALECGLPVISTDCPGGPAEILDYGRFGKLVPVNDPSMLAEAMLGNLASSHNSVALMRRAEDFSLDKISNEYISYFFPENKLSV